MNHVDSTLQTKEKKNKQGSEIDDHSIIMDSKLIKSKDAVDQHKQSL